MSYFKLNAKSIVKDSLLSLAKNRVDNNWLLLRGFNVTPVPMPLLLTDPLVLALSEKYTLKPGIFKMNPMNYYAFHTDASRNVAINMLLEGPDSYTMFGEPTESAEVTKVNQLVYEDSSYYIFDTSCPHSVLNLSKNTRYLLTIGIATPGEDYESVKEYCIQQGF
jgi:hypothetical protein